MTGGAPEVNETVWGASGPPSTVKPETVAALLCSLVSTMSNSMVQGPLAADTGTGQSSSVLPDVAPVVTGAGVPLQGRELSSGPCAYRVAPEIPTVLVQFHPMVRSWPAVARGGVAVNPVITGGVRPGGPTTVIDCCTCGAAAVPAPPAWLASMTHGAA